MPRPGPARRCPPTRGSVRNRAARCGAGSRTLGFPDRSVWHGASACGLRVAGGSTRDAVTAVCPWARAAEASVGEHLLGNGRQCAGPRVSGRADAGTHVGATDFGFSTLKDSYRLTSPSDVE